MSSATRASTSCRHPSVWSETQWYVGTTDAVFQNIDIIESYGPDLMIILAGDHVYKMDYELMLEQHAQSGADVTVGCLEVPREEATGFGVMHVDETDRIVDFLEKPADPPGMPDKPDMALASMGIYVFTTKFLFEQLRRDAKDEHSRHDFGGDMIPLHRRTWKSSRSPFPELLCPYHGPIRGVLAGCWHGRCVLAGQHRSHTIFCQRWTFTIEAGRSGPMPRSRRRRSSSMTRRVGAAWPPVRSCPAAVSCPAAKSINLFCSLVFEPIPSAS